MNIGQMMKQMQDMQSKMTDMQGRLGENRSYRQSGGGMVTVTSNAKGEMRRIKIDPKLINPAGGRDAGRPYCCRLQPMSRTRPRPLSP